VAGARVGQIAKGAADGVADWVEVIAVEAVSGEQGIQERIQAGVQEAMVAAEAAVARVNSGPDRVGRLVECLVSHFGLEEVVPLEGVE
jgi:hypothetical protein